MIDVNIIWQDGFHLTNDFLKDFKSYEGNIDFSVINQNLTD